jgi:hypothetical protein
MPISPITLQRRHAELGRIRLGYQKAITKRDGSPGTRPVKLETFRFTSPSERYIKDLATLYGGTPQAWDNNGKAEFEVYSDANTIPVIVVKGGLSQYLEHWSGGGCQRRCTGEHELLKDRPCICDPDDRLCKPTTRLSMMLPELEALGVWRMESKGWNAAAEIPAVAELAQFVGDLVPAHLNLVERRSVKDGETSRFVVPVLDLQIGTQRLRELVAEKSGTALVLESPAASGRPELEAGGQRPPGADSDPYDPFFVRLSQCTTTEEAQELWSEAVAAKLVGTESVASPRRAEFFEEFKAAAQRLPKTAPRPDADGVVDAEIVPDATEDADAVWQQVLAAAGQQGMDSEQLDQTFKERMGGLLPDEATAAELQTFLNLLEAGEAA